MRHVIELELEVRFTEGEGHAGKRIVTITPVKGDIGGAGDDVRETIFSPEN